MIFVDSARERISDLRAERFHLMLELSCIFVLVIEQGDDLGRSLDGLRLSFSFKG